MSRSLLEGIAHFCSNDPSAAPKPCNSRFVVTTLRLRSGHALVVLRCGKRLKSLLRVSQAKPTFCSNDFRRKLANSQVIIAWKETGQNWEICPLFLANDPGFARQ